MLKTMVLICSKPRELVDWCQSERSLEELVRAALVLVLGCTAAFGFVLGEARDLQQAAASALKLPLVWIVTLAVSAPLFHAIAAALGHALSLRALLALVLVATARAALVLFALVPVLWLFADVTRGSAQQYHQLTMLAALMYAVAGCAALGVLLRGFRSTLGALPVLAGFALTFFLVAGQTAWSLRPFVGRPAEVESPWFRAPESTFFEALVRGSDSARGVYHREAPRPGSAAEYRSDSERSLEEF